MSFGSRHSTAGLAPLSIRGPGTAAAYTKCGFATSIAPKSVRASTFCGITNSLLRAFTTTRCKRSKQYASLAGDVRQYGWMRILIAVFLFAPIASAQTTDATQPARKLSAKEKLEIRIRRIASPMSQLSGLAGAAIVQWEDEPPEWGQGWGAYGTRVASAEGV